MAARAQDASTPLLPFLWPMGSWNAAGCREKVTTIGIEPSCLSHVHVEGEQWGHLTNHEPGPKDGLRLGEARGASPRAGKLCVRSYPPAPPPQRRREGLPPWAGAGGPESPGRMAPGPVSSGRVPQERGAEWVPTGAWLRGVSLSRLWSPGAEQGAFPCVQL
ncbi:hypothetical protein HJG60_011125 [Phyllostomus discolor]|uniref:Uncharacterized protein n=1 Tax=Phyllostomus discolor TaxID=89673 RepID=A0A834E546_9CHIR|nr:hypothetical protein HJG60_011125 [Phyllostomus discolor]